MAAQAHATADQPQVKGVELRMTSVQGRLIAVQLSCREFAGVRSLFESQRIACYLRPLSSLERKC